MDTIDRNSPLPYYHQLAEILRREIVEHGPEHGVYALASENELSERYGLSRATVRHALGLLQSQGWIYRERGKGSFAPARRVEQELTQLVSTTEDMRARGWSLETRLVSLHELPAPPYVAHALRMPSAVPVYEVTRLRVVEDDPLSLQTAYLPAGLCPGLGEHDLTSSLYRLLEDAYGLRLWNATETLRARPASPYEAQMLAIREGQCLLYMERVTYAADGAAIEYLESVWRGDRYDFKVALSRG